MTRSLTLYVLFGLLAAPLAAAPLDLYVSPKGRDSDSGRSPAGAFATLARARDAVRAARAAGQLGGGAVVHVAAGTYPQVATLAFGPEDSGTAAAPIVYRGEGAAKPVVCGGPVLRGFTPYRDRILRLDLKAAGLAGLTFEQLFFAGRRMPLARTPNLDSEDIHGGQWAHVVDPATRGSKNAFFVTRKEVDVRRWQHPEQGRVHIFPSFDWAFNRVAIKSVDPAHDQLTLAGNVSYELTVGDRFFVEGLFEELDSPGEWYLDKAAGVLYFWPPQDLAQAEVTVPAVRELVAAKGAQHVRLEGLVLDGCDGDAVQLRDCEGVVVARSEMRNAGGWGVNIGGGHGCAVLGCDVTGTGFGGILLDGGDRVTLAPGEHRADNNHIHHIATVQRTYNCAINLNGVGNVATHNLIHDTPHAGVTIGGNDNRFEYNVVHHTNLQSTDTGGLYSCPRDWTQRGNIIRYNVWHDLGGFGKESSWQPVRDGKVGFTYPHFTWGIYMDDPTSGNLMYGNILYRVPICALHNHGGRDNVWENNIIVDAPALNAGQLDPNWNEWPAIRKRLRDRTTPGSAYLAHYPILGTYKDDHPEEMSGMKFVRNIVYYTTAGTAWLREEEKRGNKQLLYSYNLREEDFAENEFDHNLISVPAELNLVISQSRRPQPHQELSWEQWRAQGMDTHSQLGDPKFVDPARHDYRLKDDSPALALGFKPIPVDQIGLYADPLRASWPVPDPDRESVPVKRAFQVPGFEPLPALPLVVRGGLPNVAAKLAAGQPVTVAYYGGGIHGTDGWRAQLAKWLQATWPKSTFTFVDGGITDAVRGSGFSVYRFEHDVLAKQPDLVLVDYASDDFATSSLDIQRAIEGVLRQAWRQNPQLDVLFLYAFRDPMQAAYAQGVTPPAVTAYERLAERYGVPAVNLGLAALPLVQAKTWTATVPNAAANDAYAAALTKALTPLLAVGGARPHALPAPLREDNLEGAKLVAITPAMLTGAWSELPANDPLRAEQKRHFDTIWYTNQPGAKLTFTFRGTAASLFDLMGPDTGKAKVTVDGQVVGVRQQVDPWCYYHRLAAMNLADGLPMGDHTVTVELLGEVPDRSVPIADAKKLGRYQPAAFTGVALRIGWIRVVGERPGE